MNELAFIVPFVCLTQLTIVVSSGVYSGEGCQLPMLKFQ